MTYWFTSDTHFYHKNIIKYCDRPFSSVEEMNELIITSWNAVIRPGDSVYHLGDFSFGSVDQTKNILKRLMGQKFLVLGNHDKKLMKTDVFSSSCAWVRDLAEIQVPDQDAYRGEQRITLCHYPLMTWNKSHHGTWSLHGHCHGTLPPDPHSLRLDVGVDVHGFRPISYDEVKATMKTKTFKPIDHHGAD